MFAARGIAVSFSVFAVVYCVLSLAVSCGWNKVWRRSHRRRVGPTANYLFALRMLPLVAAAVITAAFTIPSFLLLEPRAIEEPVGRIPLVLSACGALLVIRGVVNAGTALRKASGTVATWTQGARLVQSSGSVPVLRISPSTPAMTTAGIIHPRVLLSGAAELLLTERELQTGLNHELAHVRRRDNLKKLLIRFVAFPAMSSLEATWLEAAEMAADDAAVSTTAEALDLAAALIKLSRLAPVEQRAELTAGLVHGPGSVVHARVERLIAWSDDRRAPAQGDSPWFALGAAFATVAMFAMTYGQLLVHMHTATEWLVR